MTNNSKPKLIPLRERIEMSKSGDLSPSAAAAKLKRLRRMPLRSYFCNQREPFTRFYDRLHDKITVNNTFEEACLELRSKIELGLEIYGDEGCRRFAEDNVLSDALDAMLILSEMIAESGRPGIKSDSPDSLHRMVNMTFDSYLKALYYLFSDGYGNVYYKLPCFINRHGLFVTEVCRKYGFDFGPFFCGSMFTDSVRTMVELCRKEAKLLVEHYQYGSISPIKSYNRSIGIKLRDDEEAVQALNEHALNCFMELYGLIVEPFCIISDSAGCEKTDALRTFSSSSANISKLRISVK